MKRRTEEEGEREMKKKREEGKKQNIRPLWTLSVYVFVCCFCVCVHEKAYSASFLTFSLVIIFLNLNPKPSRLFVSGSVVRDITFILLTNVDL